MFDENEQRLEKKFWEELNSSPFMMVGVQGVDDAFTRPMTAEIDGGRIWFFAARSDALVKAIGQGGRAVATYASKGHDLFASIHGRLEISNDREVVGRLWNPSIGNWFEQGKDDPDLALVRLDATSADIWEAQPGSRLKATAINIFGGDAGKQHRDEYRASVSLEN